MINLGFYISTDGADVLALVHLFVNCPNNVNEELFQLLISCVFWQVDSPPQALSPVSSADEGFDFRFNRFTTIQEGTSFRLA